MPTKSKKLTEAEFNQIVEESRLKNQQKTQHLQTKRLAEEQAQVPVQEHQKPSHPEECIETESFQRLNTALFKATIAYARPLRFTLVTKEEIEAELNSPAEREAEAVQEILQICNARIEYYQSLLLYINTTDDLREIRINLKKSNAPTPVTIIGSHYRHDVVEWKTKIELVNYYQGQIEIYRRYKKFLLSNIKDYLLLEWLYDEILQHFEKFKEDYSKQDKEDPRLDYYHWNKMLRVLKPFLSPAYEAYSKMHLNSRSSNIIESCKRNLLHAEECTKKVNKFLVQLATHQNLVSQEEVRDIKKQVLEIQSSLGNLIETLKEIVDTIGKNINLNPSLTLFNKNHSMASRRMDFDKNVILENSMIQEEYKHLQEHAKSAFYKVYALEENFKRLDNRFLQIVEAAAQEQKLKNELQCAHERAQKLAAARSMQVREAQVKAEKIKNKETRYPHAKLISVSTVALLEKSDIEKRLEAEVILFKKQKELDLQLYRENVEKERQEKERQYQNRTKILLEDLESDEDDVKNNNKLSNIEIEQLKYIQQRIKNHLEVFDNIFNQKPKIVFSELKTLIFRLEGEIHFVGSSHFKLVLPNTHKEWNKGIDGYRIERRHKTGRTSWYPHGEPHNNEVLSAFAVARCVEAFTKAGITPARLATMLNSSENTNSLIPKK